MAKDFKSIKFVKSMLENIYIYFKIFMISVTLFYRKLLELCSNDLIMYNFQLQNVAYFLA